MATSKIKIEKNCEWCGRKFYAQKITTRFCSKRCNEHAYKDKLRHAQVTEAIHRTESKSMDEMRGKEFLSIREAATILGITVRATYNLIYRGQLKASKLSPRMTIIQKSSIQAMLDSFSYVKAPRKKNEPITEFYTTTEIKEKFGVSNSWIFKVGKEKNIPKLYRMGNTYWSKSHIEKAVAALQPDESINEWYSATDMQQKFNMTLSAIYNFAHDHSVPKKKVKREVFYSKRHVDIAKGLIEPEKPQYYTMQEAMEKFGMTRDQIYHYTKVFGVPKVMEGKYVKISRKELDEALALPKI